MQTVSQPGFLADRATGGSGIPCMGQKFDLTQAQVHPRFGMAIKPGCMARKDRGEVSGPIQRCRRMRQVAEAVATHQNTGLRAV